MSPRLRELAIRQWSRFLSPMQRARYSESCRRHAARNTNHSLEWAEPRPSYPQSRRSLWSDRQHCSANRSTRITRSIASRANPLPTDVTGEVPGQTRSWDKVEKQRFAQGTAAAVGLSSAGRPGRNVTVTFFARMKPSSP